MRKLLILTALLLGSCVPRQTISPIKHGDLSKDIAHILQDTILRTATVSIKVVDLSTNKTIYQKYPEKLLLPASNGKIFTAVTALYYLGPWYKTHTDFFADSSGNLYIKGYGDMGFTYKDMLFAADRIKEKLKKPPQYIYVDASYFDTLQLGQGWMWDDLQYYYSARISALGVDENVVTIYVKPRNVCGLRPEVKTFPPSNFFCIVNNAITVGDSDSLRIHVNVKTVHDTVKIFVDGQIPMNSPTKRFFRSYDMPERFFGYHMGELLSGGRFHGCVRETTFTPDSTLDTLLILPSAPLSELIRQMMKWSSNYKAECILKLTSAVIDSPPGSAWKGLKLAKHVLSEAGIDTTKFRLVDGSGLSRYDLVSADIITKLLAFAYNKFSLAPEFIASLPIGGKDGTLRKRLVNDSVFVRAKTGTMASVSSLSGYLKTNSGHTLAFSIIINNFIGSAKLAKHIEDLIVERLKQP